MAPLRYTSAPIAKELSEQMRTYCKLEHLEPILVYFFLNVVLTSGIQKLSAVNIQIRD